MFISINIKVVEVTRMKINIKVKMRERKYFEKELEKREWCLLKLSIIISTV